MSGLSGARKVCASAAVLCLFLSPVAFAFDSTAWLEKRARLIEDATRLRIAYTNCVANLQMPAEDVSVPVEMFDDGSVKVIVFAKKAQYFLEAGLVWAEDVQLKKFKPDGSEDAVISAKSCVVDRLSKSGWAEGSATVTHGKTVFCGSGVYFSSPEAFVRVFDESDVISSDLKFGGVRP